MNFPARVGSGGAIRGGGFDGLEARPLGLVGTRLALDRRSRATSRLRRDASPSAAGQPMARLISQIDVERPARHGGVEGDAAVERRGGPRRVARARASRYRRGGWAFGDRRPGTRTSEIGQHHFTPSATCWRRRSRSAPRRDAPQPSGAEAGLDVIHAELVIAPLTLDGDVLSRDRGEA